MLADADALAKHCRIRLSEVEKILPAKNAESLTKIEHQKVFEKLDHSRRSRKSEPIQRAAYAKGQDQAKLSDAIDPEKLKSLPWANRLLEYLRSPVD